VLTATNAVGTSSCERIVEVNGPPTSSFASNSPIYLGEPAIFTNTTVSQPPVEFWLWAFDPGMSTRERPAPITYTTVGDHVVSLAAVNGYTGPEGNSDATTRLHRLQRAADEGDL